MAQVSTATYAPSRSYMDQSGAFNLGHASFYNSTGTDIAPLLERAPSLVSSTSANNLYIASSTGVLSTTNPTSIVTGLGTVRFFSAELQSSVILTTGLAYFLRHVNSATAGEVHLYAWKATATAGEVLANTSSADFKWFALGTT